MSFTRFTAILWAALFIFAGSIPNGFAQNKTETAVFAGGCFWCMHAAFEGLPGVVKVHSGYTGGHVVNPTYEEVSSGTTGHVEAIQVIYDPSKVKYEKLLEWFWDNVDPNDSEGQFCDKGSQYMAGVFYADAKQKAAAEKSVKVTEGKLHKKVSLFLRKADKFYVAEDYHQSYYKKNELRYKLYKAGCGREQTLQKIRHSEEFE